MGEKKGSQGLTNKEREDGMEGRRDSRGRHNIDEDGRLANTNKVRKMKKERGHGGKE